MRVLLTAIRQRNALESAPRMVSSLCTMSEEIKEYCSCKLLVRGDDLDPAQVTTLLGVDPSEAYRRGDHLPYPRNHERAGQPSDLMVQTGAWRLEVDAEKKWSWDAAAQLDYWCVFLTNREAAIRELQARGYEVMIDCYIDEGPVAYVELSAELLQTLGNLGVAVKFGFYDRSELQSGKTS